MKTESKGKAKSRGIGERKLGERGLINLFSMFSQLGEQKLNTKIEKQKVIHREDVFC